jgi:hypothetical protein
MMIALLMGLSAIFALLQGILPWTWWPSEDMFGRITAQVLH